MCFFIHPKHQGVKVATKDINCYKVVTADLRAYYQSNFKYYLNK